MQTLKWKILIRQCMSTKRNLAIIAGTVSLSVLLVVLYLFSAQKPNQNILTANQQVWDLVEDIRQYYRTRPDVWGLNSNYVIEHGIADNFLVSDGKLKNALGKEMVVGADSDGNIVMPGSRNFAITYKNLNYKECVDLSSVQQNELQLLSLTSIVITNNKSQTQFIWGGKHPLPISRPDAKQACGEENSITWFLYI